MPLNSYIICGAQ